MRGAWGEQAAGVTGRRQGHGRQRRCFYRALPAKAIWHKIRFAAMVIRAIVPSVAGPRCLSQRPSQPVAALPCELAAMPQRSP